MECTGDLFIVMYLRMFIELKNRAAFTVALEIQTCTVVDANLLKMYSQEVSR